jgi:hypothetical protein
MFGKIFRFESETTQTHSAQRQDNPNARASATHQQQCAYMAIGAGVASSFDITNTIINHA